MRYTKRSAAVILLGVFAALSVPFVALSAELSSTAQSEISHILAYIEKSGCQFYRNGTWYRDTKVAREHVERKYRYFAGKGRVSSTEDFITWAASKSELSGTPYMVKTGDASPVPLAHWLTEELARYRRETSTSRNE
jgi:hypothetical protein